MDIIKIIAVYFERPIIQKIALSGLLFLVLLISKRLLVGFIDKRVSSPRSLYSWKKTTSTVILILGILGIIRIWLGGLASLTTYAGLVSAGIAIALKDMLANLAGWIFIMWRKPFEVGNRIQIGETAGDVIDMRPFQFTMLEIGNWVKADQSTGRMIHIPNSFVFTQPLANYDSGFRYIWNEIPVLVTFDSNWETAKSILLDIANNKALALTGDVKKEIETAAKKYMIIYNKITPVVFTSVEDSGILLTIRYLTEIRQRRGTAELIWEEILRQFAIHDDIELAYNTFKIYQTNQ
ncbi:MAG: mechanosensitive ion channel protein MscS [Candidatus Cloacimonetes bacterium HGW-Cloacimonetes-3]|jgi:small-conductance mechanosensitive channel|nr:MAG: mechanosensitive ion channel protein MscS [Candidatus Cloacimonetes bacterium HGW-Cloacimonetes-3]